MSQAKAGDTVQIHYTGTFDDGTVFDSSEGREPLKFELGSGQIIPGLDAAINGMSLGEKKTAKIPAAEAYGEVNPDARQAVPRDQLPADLPTEIGTTLQMQTPDGRAMPVVIADADETTITIDANHPLAGKDLTFAVEIVAIG